MVQSGVYCSLLTLGGRCLFTRPRSSVNGAGKTGPTRVARAQTRRSSKHLRFVYPSCPEGQRLREQFHVRSGLLVLRENKHHVSVPSCPGPAKTCSRSPNRRLTRNMNPKCFLVRQLHNISCFTDHATHFLFCHVFICGPIVCLDSQFPSSTLEEAKASQHTDALPVPSAVRLQLTRRPLQEVNVSAIVRL